MGQCDIIYEIPYIPPQTDHLPQSCVSIMWKHQPGTANPQHRTYIIHTNRVSDRPVYSSQYLSSMQIKGLHSYDILFHIIGIYVLYIIGMLSNNELTIPLLGY